MSPPRGSANAREASDDIIDLLRLRLPLLLDNGAGWGRSPYLPVLRHSDGSEPIGCAERGQRLLQEVQRGVWVGYDGPSSNVWRAVQQDSRLELLRTTARRQRRMGSRLCSRPSADVRDLQRKGK